ncbi:MAG: cell wall hydrolase [Novosphingobium sp.]|uniref:cell wall hydrolase n=1 Tax=Novosphingobium sp. TaxID=1874826 RepID=UPI0032BCAD6A
MSKQLRRASVIAVAAMISSIAFSTNGFGADAQSSAPAASANQPSPQMISQPVVQSLPVPAPAVLVEADEAGLNAPQLSARSLAELVAGQPHPSELSRELQCLAGAVYFEAKSESLVGQLAVGRVVVARSKSGRFPNSYCGVVFQPSQFSFVRGSSMPAIARGSKQWKNAVAIAQIAHAGSWRSPVEGALYFHASYVSPGWKLRRVGRVENHVFYR